MNVPAVILAGGLSRRMGGPEKAFLRLGEMRLIDRVIARAAPQCGSLAINANGDPARFEGLGLPVLPDRQVGNPGPLAGILAALRWASDGGHSHVATVPVDCPFLPDDLLGRLTAHGSPSVAATADGLHPVCGYWPVEIAEALETAVARGERRARFAAELSHAVPVQFSGTPNPFFNINTQADLAEAQSLL